MVSLKAIVNHSLQIKLSLWLSSILIVMGLISTIFSFVSSFREMNEMQDDLLRQMASLFDAEHLPIPHQNDTGRLANSDEESRVIVQYLTNANIKNNAVESDIAIAFPSTLVDGIQTVSVDNESYRVLVKTISDDSRIAIAQETAIRNEIAEAGALRTLIPFLISLPVLLFAINILIRTLFKPITILSDEVKQRREDDLHAFEASDLPSEIKPLVHAINSLLVKVAASIRLQRRFIADAAHELRSPMTALSLQVDHLVNAEMSNQARERANIVRQGLERNRHLLNQLLEFARLQSASPAKANMVSVLLIYRKVVEDLHALAEIKGLDLGLLGNADSEVYVNEIDLYTLVRNLVDNAIRYTPNGGKIDLGIQVQGNQTHLFVADTGPGIPIEERQRVTDPFYRLPGSNQIGSGLGLSIVKEIVVKMGWQINFRFTDETLQQGLTVSIVIDRH